MTQTIIKNLHLLESTNTMRGTDLDKMEQAALMHRRISNITFKITEMSDNMITFQVVQGKSSAENYFNQKRLVEIVKETFGKFFPGKKVLGHAIVYKEPAPSIVDIKWINKMMLDTGTKLKTISEETGIATSQISAILNEHTELSQPMKALFWYYFLAKQPERS